MNINVLTISGRIGSVKNLLTSQNGSAAVNFTVGVQSNRKNAKTGGYETAWYNVKKWYQNAEFANKVQNSLKVGGFACVTGTLDFDPVTGGPVVFTRKDGSVGASFNVTAQEIHVASNQSSQPASQQQYQQRQSQQSQQYQQAKQNQQRPQQQYQQNQQRPKQPKNEQVTPEMYTVDDSFDSDQLWF